MGRVLYADGALARDDRPKFTLGALQKIVGGYIECLHLRGGEVLVCNEEGKLLGLPVNFSATEYVRSQGINDVIVGNVVICSRNQID